MKRTVPALLIPALLAGCGGTSGESSWSQQPAATTQVQPTSQFTQDNSVPATQPSATTLNGGNLTISVSGGDYIVRGPGAVNLSIEGNANNVTIPASQTMGQISVVGGGNVLIFRSGATVRTLHITGSNNTVWIPLGSGISLASGSVSGTQVRIYTP